ncbi:hypothetical protein GCM10009600_24640 [Oerskovia paurometabola]
MGIHALKRQGSRLVKWPATRSMTAFRRYLNGDRVPGRRERVVPGLFDPVDDYASSPLDVLAHEVGDAGWES